MGPRLKRCGKCLPCNRGDCGVCHNCADKPKFGGSGVKKQACVARRCISMLRREMSPSPPLGSANATGASPSAVLDLWDPASWQLPADSLSDALSGSAIGDGEAADGGLTGEGGLSEMLESGTQLLAGAGFDGESMGEKAAALLRADWPMSCLEEDDNTAAGDSNKGEARDEEALPTATEVDANELPTMPFATQNEAPAPPVEDGDDTPLSLPLGQVGLGLDSLAHLPPVDDDTLASTGLVPCSVRGEQAPESPPFSACTEEEETMLRSADGPILIDSRTLTPSDAGALDPTGGDSPLDEQDYCGWLAEDI